MALSLHLGCGMLKDTFGSVACLSFIKIFHFGCGHSYISPYAQIPGVKPNERTGMAIAYVGLSVCPYMLLHTSVHPISPLQAHFKNGSMRSVSGPGVLVTFFDKAIPKKIYTQLAD